MQENQLDEPLYTEDKRTALQSKEYAQWIAFAPMIFQSARVLRDSGILRAIAVSKKAGITLEDIVKKVNLPNYGVRVLVEAGLGIDLILLREDRYFLTRAAVFLLNDELTRVNMNFTHDVCYKGMFHLEESVRNEKPEGLKVLGNWKTIYEGLSQLPPAIQESWFDFDHYYSDNAFDQVLPLVFDGKPQRLLDIGGNTGKWAMKCAAYDKDVEITIFDLPGQAAMAKKNVENLGIGHRIKFHEGNVLLSDGRFPKGFDAIWMSQFLDCFSEKEIVMILKNCAEALNEGGRIFILETFWDRQRFEASAFCLQMTSLYFTAMANGNSQMYDSKVFLDLLPEAGLEMAEMVDHIGVSHSLVKCRKRK